MEPSATKPLKGRELIYHVRRNRIDVKKDDSIYRKIIEELEEVGKNISEYNCSASRRLYEDLIDLLPEDERDRQRKVLDALAS